MPIAIQRSARRPIRILLLAFPSLIAATSASHAALKISTKPTSNVTCSGGVCTATASHAVLNANDLASMLSTGNVTVASGSQAWDINVDTLVSWTSANRLTLDSHRSITFNKPVVVAGTGALTITTNDGGSGGDFRFFKTGHIKFWDMTSNLVINGNRYALAKSILQIRKLVDKGSGAQYIALAKKINATRYSGGPLPFEPTILEGLGNTISNLMISSGTDGSDVGLFVQMNGTVRDIGFVNANIIGFGDDQAVGTIAGRVNGAILYCSVTGKVSAAGALSGAGGLAGVNNGSIAGSYSDASVSVASGGTVAGGLVAGSEAGNQGQWKGSIKESYSTGAVTGGDGVKTGGLVGYNLGGSISNSYSTGSVMGGNNSLVGGLSGGNAISDSSSPTIASSYSTGAVIGGSGAIVGGFIGEDLAQTGTTNSYWDLDTSGISDSSQGAGNVANDPGITGLTTEQFKSGLPVGFGASIWKEKVPINTGYPYLIDNPPS